MLSIGVIIRIFNSKKTLKQMIKDMFSDNVLKHINLNTFEKANKELIQKLNDGKRENVRKIKCK
jgi:hypothetical protein